MVYECTVCMSSLITSATELTCHLQSTQCYSARFSLKIICSFSFSEVVSVPMVCLFCVSISKKPAQCFPWWVQLKRWLNLPRLLFLLKLITPSSRDLKSSLEQAGFLKLYLEGHRCFLQRLALFLCLACENVLATKPVIMYATKSFCVV